MVGYEPLVTAQAGHRVGLSAGARVVHVAAGRLDAPSVGALRAARPDVVLLVGGTDGGDADVLLHNAARLARARLRVPVVVAGNADVRDEVLARSAARPGCRSRRRQRAAPDRGARPAAGAGGDPGGVPAARDRRQAAVPRVRGSPSLVRGATPDVGADRRGAARRRGSAATWLVVDVGGATTDVYSVLVARPGCAAPADVAGTLWRARTVEGDLGMRWSAPGVVGRPRPSGCSRARMTGCARRRRGARPTRRWSRASRPSGPSTPGWPNWPPWSRCAGTPAVNRATVAAGSVVDLRRLRLVVGSGGVLRHAAPGDAQRALTAVLTDQAGGWALPRAAQSIVDYEYALAPIGLLAGRHPPIASALAHALIAVLV